MSWRLWKPRPIASYEARILRRVIEVDADCLPSAALLASIEHLIVQEEGDGQAHHDSLDFGTTNSHGEIIAIALGTMTNDGHIELFLWADGETITALELEPFDGTRLPIRMPVLESIRPYPADPYGIEVDDEAAVQDSVANPVSD